MRSFLCRAVAIVSVSVLSSFAGGAALADTNGRFGYYDHPMMWGGWFAGPLMMILFIAVIVGVAFAIVRFLGRHEAGGGRKSDALEILRERLARGEIEVAEYEERKKALGD